MESFDFIESGYLFLFISFPICGLFISKIFDRKTSLKIVLASLLLLVSRFTGYVVIGDWLYVLCILFLLSILYAYLIRSLKTDYTIILSLMLVFLLFLSTLAYLFLNAFGGVSEETVASDRSGRYKVETVVVSGFSGRTAPDHKLYFYPFWILIYKNVETINIDPFNESELKECIVSFKTSPVVYNSCLHEIE